jgi:hypothetical protein
LIFRNTQNQDITLEFFDIDGKIIFSENKFMNIGNQEIEINTQNWAPGIYLLQMKTSEGIINHRVIKN